MLGKHLAHVSVDGGGGCDSIDCTVVFTSDTTMTITPRFTNSGVSLQYSTNEGANWTTIASGGTTTSAKIIAFRGRATGTKALFTSSSTDNAWTFTDATNLVASGNLNYLLCDSMGGSVAPTTLGKSCYDSMFFSCKSLTTAPELPATILADKCYRNMFYNCTLLTTAPELPSTA